MAGDGSRRPARWWLVALTWVWVPLHGMWVVGISIAVAAVVGIALTRKLDRTPPSCAWPRSPCSRPPSPWPRPSGLDVVRSVVGVGARNDALTEWGPPDFTSPARSSSC